MSIIIGMMIIMEKHWDDHHGEVTKYCGNYSVDGVYFDRSKVVFCLVASWYQRWDENYGSGGQYLHTGDMQVLAARSGGGWLLVH